MGRCVKCGKKELFLKVNSEGLCLDCEVEKEVKPLALGGASSGINTGKKDTPPVLPTTVAVGYL
ncbi:MAG: hypothetical protein LBG05_03140 [Treponema sp.]|jgi:hypothetical protein|nr:hypothetical protein [Treponema sp.]